MESDRLPIRLRILVFEDLPGIWTARALEHDLLAEGRTMEAAVHAVLRIMRAHIEFDRRHNREPLSGFGAAPQVYWNAFTRALPLAWASRLAAMLPLSAEVAAAVALERPRTSASNDVVGRPTPPGFPSQSCRSAHAS
jgi:hypothetical protein